MKKLFFLLPVFIFADVNPFGAGNLDSGTPYGLTPQEKAILKNKKDISKLRIQVNYLNDQINQIKLKLSNYDDLINQKLSGFDTVINEINAEKIKIKQLQKTSEEYNQSIELINKKITSLEQNITAIKETIKEMSKIQNENFNALKNAISEILTTIKKSNKPMSAKEAFLKARKLFFSNKLNQAKELFSYSLQKKYLPATSSYYLGEIAYKEGNYKQALAYYKTSVKYYPKKTSFTARLLYHTGISFIKTGNKQGAKLTFEKLIQDFPDSKYAKLAKKELENLK